MKKYTLYWLDGKREVVEGNSISDAVNAAGYGYGALKALDFWAEGDNDEYRWDEDARTWRGKA